ncbi:MAG: S8 family serine peptidase, partial [Methanosarcinaceae archaeon]|nr:S8 family serine peptidase [Methanosarcinaceae archaeon]
MKSIEKIIVVLIVCSVIFGAMPVSGYAKEKKVSNLPGPDTYAPGEVIVKLKSGSSDAEISKIISKYNAKTAKKILKDNKKRDKLAEKSLKKFGIERIYILEVSESSDINKLVNKLNNNPDVEYAEPNYIVHIDTNPNDTFFSNLWGLHNTGQTGGTVDADIDAPEAWEIQTGSSDVVIAVIDSGVDYLHPDLERNIWTNPGETPDDGLDNDNNGYTDDVHGYDFVSDDGAPLDGYGHGTHVAGTIGAVGNNDLGIVGVNWNVAIMPIRFLGNTGSGTTTDGISSIIYAIDNGADILSNSWGGGSYSSGMKDTISAANDAGILFVAAAGNADSNNDNNPHYPSSYYVPNVVAVAATDNNDGKPSFSNYGLKSVDLGAPGAIIYSTVPTEGGSLSDPSGYKNLSGTSMATPHVAGVAGLIKAQFPQYSSDEIKARLLESVDNIPSLNGITVTGGRLNAKNSLIIAPLSVLFYDDMETAGGWTHSGSGDNWESGTPLSGPGSAKSGTNVWATKLNGDYAINNMDARLTSPSIDLSIVSSANLTFYHHYDMESTTDGSIGYDGGILEASGDGGSSWTRITPVGGYPTDISTRYNNPLGGGSAYSHYSGAGWHYAVFDMSNYVGSSDAKIQFRFATDSSVNDYPGWYIDDVTVLGELIEPNIAPVALDDSYNVNEDTALAPAIGVLDNDTDADNDVLSAVLVAVPSNGALTLISDGSFTYIPAANFNGADNFTYKAKDSKNAESSPATVTITVNPVNDIPVALDDSYSVNEDTSLDVPAAGVLSNDTDADNDALSAELVAVPSNGTLTLNSNGSFTYTPVASFNGADSFTYKANDGMEDSNIAIVTILVNAINNVPVAVDDSYNVNEDTHLEVSAATGVLDNDTDADNDALSAVL